MKNITTSRITASSRWYCTHSALVNTCSGLLAPKIYASPRLPATTMVVGAFCRSHARESCAMVICCASGDALERCQRLEQLLLAARFAVATERRARLVKVAAAREARADSPRRRCTCR